MISRACGKPDKYTHKKFTCLSLFNNGKHHGFLWYGSVELSHLIRIYTVSLYPSSLSILLLVNLSIFGSLIAVNRVKKHKIFVLITSARNEGSYENTNPYFPVKLVKYLECHLLMTFANS